MKKILLLSLAIALSAGLLIIDLVDIFGDKPLPPAEQPAELQALPESFQSFYARFHRDENFQLEHILWPLEGLPAMADEQTLRESTFTWKQPDWVPHKLPTEVEGDFPMSFTQLDDGLIVEVIRQGTTDLGIERRWAEVNGKWMLVYYAGTNVMSWR
ncbi:MAG: hypothetical protein ACO4CH_07345 [Saprospiraceae bacterium]